MLSEIPPPNFLNRLITGLGDFLIFCIRTFRKIRSKFACLPAAKAPSDSSNLPPVRQEAAPTGAWSKIKRYHETTPLGRLRLMYYAGFAFVFVCMGLWVWQTWPKASPRTAPDEDSQVVISRLVSETSQAISQSKLDLAEQTLRDLEKLQPDHRIILTLSGSVKSLRKDFDGAREDYMRALRMEPNSFAASYNLAELEFVAGNYKKSLSQFEKLHEIRPRDEIVIFRLYLCCLLLEESAAAERWFQRLPPATLSPASHYASAARLFHASQNSQARQVLESARILFPEKNGFYEATFSELNYR